MFINEGVGITNTNPILNVETSVSKSCAQFSLNCVKFKRAYQSLQKIHTMQVSLACIVSIIVFKLYEN